MNNGDYMLVDASAVEYQTQDGNSISVQEALDNASTDNSTHKTVIFENNIDMGKYLLLAKITDANYSNNIIKFSCPNYKGVNDAGFKYENDMDILKFELHFNTGAMRETNSYGVTLKQHGLGLYSYPLNNPQNVEPRLEEAIRLYWDYSKGDIYVFLVDLMTAIPHCVLEYTGSGTLIRNNTFVMDDIYNRRDGLNGTWEDSKWSSIPYNKLETPPIYELGGNGGSAEGAITYTSLTELGLTADATFQDAIDTLPKGGSALLGVKEFTNYQTIFPYKEENDQFARVHVVKGVADGSCMYARWFRKDGGKEAIAIFNTNDNKFGGWQMLKNQQVYTALKELGLDTTATINDIVVAMKDGTTFTYKTDVFDYATEYENLRYATVTIIKQTTGRIQIFMTDKNTGDLYIGKMSSDNKVDGWKKTITEDSKTDPYSCTGYKVLTGTEDLFTLPCGHYVTDKTDTSYNYPITDSSTVTAHIYVLGCLNDTANNKGYRIILYFDNKNRMYRINEWWGSFANGWQKIQTDSSTKVTLAFNSKTFKIDITKRNKNWNGNMKFGYFVDNSYGEIIISSLGITNVSWSCSEGVRYVKSVTYTIDPDNNAHVTIGVEFHETVYGVHQLETAGDFATINSFTGDAFTGTSVAVREGVKGRNNGVGILYKVEDLGLTFPCTTLQIVQAIRNKTIAANRLPANSMIGIFDVGPKTSSVTDAPTDYGLLHIETSGHDRIMIRYDGISSSSYIGSWIGQIKGSNGTFSGITWTRLDNDTRVTTLETQVSELFQSVSDGKTLVANAITGKGVSTATNATFATMATNIGKISGGYKEETKSLIVTSNTTGIEALPFTFSANVIAVKRIVAPSDGCHIVPQTSKDMLTINGKELVLYVSGSGTWKVTALIEK